MEKSIWRLTRFLVLGLSSASMAATLPPGTKVHFATCTRAGVEHGCVVADSGGATFNVTGAAPGIHPFQWLQGTAATVNKMSFCMQGQIVQNFVPDPQQHLVACVDPKKVKLKG